MTGSTERARAPLAPASIVVGLLIAFCALLLLKWLAVVALVAAGIAVALWWARRDPTAPRPVAAPAVRPVAPVAQRVAAAGDCSWCGRPGGHRDVDGLLVRPRHAHRVL